LNPSDIHQIDMENKNNDILDEVTGAEYKYGFYTDLEMDQAPKGLTEDTIRFISAKKERTGIYA
jgi:Fe-S cluster assembly protein SufB